MRVVRVQSPWSGEADPSRLEVLDRGVTTWSGEADLSRPGAFGRGVIARSGEADLSRPGAFGRGVAARSGEADLSRPGAFSRGVAAWSGEADLSRPFRASRSAEVASRPNLFPRRANRRFVMGFVSTSVLPGLVPSWAGPLVSWRFAGYPHVGPSSVAPEPAGVTHRASVLRRSIRGQTWSSRCFPFSAGSRERTRRV